MQKLSPYELQNPYKFRVRRNAAMNTTGGSFAKITFDTEDFDTNNNFASGTYTAPVSGYYQLNGRASFGSNPGQALVGLYINGALYQRGSHLHSASAVQGPMYADLVHLNAGDTVEIWCYADNTVAFETAGGAQSYFSGYLVSLT